ncbi:MAG: MBL fold metallo-hydrolase [Chloroflexota bacterium]
MKIKWLGHACFLITSDSGLKLITDPYEPNFYGIISYAPVTETCDIATLSHQHGDHNYTKTLKGNFQTVQGAGKHQAKGIEITGTPSYHDKTSGKERGENTIFSFTIDGIRLCHCGDLGHPLNDATIRALGKVDILLIPTGGPEATLELGEALELRDKLKPAVTIPMHFRNQKCTFPQHGEDDLIKLKPYAVRAGKSEVEFQAGRLPQNQILILEPAL